ncbi:MAG: hypothetical protein K5786_09315 [Treponema sp.]|nr:hypothetical protein [Treponema sp.]
MKKTKLKFAAAVAALAMTFALFTGCNPGEDATTDNTSGGTETTTQTPTESGDGEEENTDDENEETLDNTIKSFVISSDETALGTGWSTGVTLAADKFTDLTTSHILRLTLSIGSEEYHQLKFVSNNETLSSSFGDVNSEYGTISIWQSGAWGVKLTSDDVTAIKANGLYIGGYDVTISKIEAVAITGSFDLEEAEVTGWGGGTASLVSTDPVTSSNNSAIKIVAGNYGTGIIFPIDSVIAAKGIVARLYRASGDLGYKTIEAFTSANDTTYASFKENCKGPSNYGDEGSELGEKISGFDIKAIPANAVWEVVYFPLSSDITNLFGLGINCAGSSEGNDSIYYIKDIYYVTE